MKSENMVDESKIDPNLKGAEFEAALKAQQGAPRTSPEEEPQRPPIQLYIIKTKISNENFVAESKDVNDKQKLYTYKFAKDIRDRIKAIRMKHKSPIYFSTLDFYGLRVCGEESKVNIQKAIDTADRDFKTLRAEYVHNLAKEMMGDETLTKSVKDIATAAKEKEEKDKGSSETPEKEPQVTVAEPETGEDQKLIFLQSIANQATPKLGASVMFIPLDFQQIFKGNLYGQITDAIQYQVYSGLFERMEGMLKRTAEGKELPERSRNALIKMVDSLKSINVTQDANVFKKLEDIRAKIVDGDLKEVAASLKSELDAGKSRWAAIEL